MFVSSNSRLSMNEPVRQVPAAKGQMALTINVDWGNDELVAMLDVLDNYETKATFFLTGRWTKNFPELAKEVARRGHEIGNHGMSHAHPTHLSDGDLRTLIEDNIQLLKETTGTEPVPLFAPPYGEQDERVVRIASSLGQWTTLWTLDTIDWQNPSPDVIVQRILPRASDGAIILMHPKPQSLQALPTIIEGLKEKGFMLVPLGQMMGL